ncbi:hypothetical protein HMF8227_01574 [Saliniradius amylolyticus]|uniref:Uncharacterized protein n=1 Tax=Saliniradius amylolyticus TaxID=2183582 RepID=A0A2S2E324_9ALTE|nr:hypothetical protein [Saliniradius amylolyticus]AWL12048.1 hypothetical protein HMF8227_01574 [Saliniradius amylolyticus]
MTPRLKLLFVLSTVLYCSGCTVLGGILDHSIGADDPALQVIGEGIDRAILHQIQNKKIKDCYDYPEGIQRTSCLSKARAANKAIKARHKQPPSSEQNELRSHPHWVNGA